MAKDKGNKIEVGGGRNEELAGVIKPVNNYPELEISVTKITGDKEPYPQALLIKLVSSEQDIFCTLFFGEVTNASDKHYLSAAQNTLKLPINKAGNYKVTVYAKQGDKKISFDSSEVQVRFKEEEIKKPNGKIVGIKRTDFGKGNNTGIKK
jgi:hypothetical protein